MRYRLKTDLEDITERASVLGVEDEKHYFFGLNDIFSFDEEGSVFSLVEKDSETLIIHDFCRMNDLERFEGSVEKEQAVDFLRKTGYEPFMRIDISRYFLELGDDEFIVEDVEQLGVFTDRPDLGAEKVFYGELLKQEMLDDSEKEEKVRQEARTIMQD